MRGFVMKWVSKWIERLRNPKKTIGELFELLRDPKRAFREWYGSDLKVDEMSEQDRLNILYDWFIRTAMVMFVWFPLFAWLFTLCFGEGDLIMDFVVMHGSAWQIYFIFISRFVLITCGKLVFTFSQGTGVVILYVLKEWLKKW